MSRTGRREEALENLADLIGSMLSEAPVIDEIETLIERHPLERHAALREGLRLLEAARGDGLTIAEWVSQIKDRGFGDQGMATVRILIEEFGCCVTRKAQLVFVYSANPTPSLDEFDLRVDESAVETVRLNRADNGDAARYRLDQEAPVTNEQTMADLRKLLHPGR